MTQGTVNCLSACILSARNVQYVISHAIIIIHQFLHVQSDIPLPSPLPPPPSPPPLPPSLSPSPLPTPSPSPPPPSPPPAHNRCCSGCAPTWPTVTRRRLSPLYWTSTTTNCVSSATTGTSTLTEALTQLIIIIIIFYSC